MAEEKARSFRKVLQEGIRIEDEIWSYEVPNLPNPTTRKLMKSIAIKSNSEEQQIALKFDAASDNRAICSYPLARFINISFADFRLRVPSSALGNGSGATQQATARESSDYIIRLLRAGVILNGVHYNFYGHSNSQLKSRTCLLFADSKLNIQRMVENLGDFSKMKTVAKKSKRIGLLFSTAQVAIVLEPSRCRDIPDIETNDYIFTDGCGLIAPSLANELARKLKITYRNVRYTPCVFQIRYRGYKGVLMLDPTMKGEVLAKFRKSMKKFSGGNDYSFSVVDKSKVNQCFGLSTPSFENLLRLV